MDIPKIKAAKKEAQDFIKACNAVIKESKEWAESALAYEKGLGLSSESYSIYENPDYFHRGTRKTGALRRQSLDLTRVLADL